MMRLLVLSRKEEERALALLARRLLRTETRRGGRNASGGAFPAVRDDVGIPIAALKKRRRGFHGSASRWLVEDREGRGLTEEIIEGNLVRFSLAFCFLYRALPCSSSWKHKYPCPEHLFSSVSFKQDRKRGAAMKQNDAHVKSALLTTRKEALSLYRAVIRASVLFVWKDTKGRMWKDVIRESARKEFEEGKHERDPEMVNRLILSGREAVDAALDRFMEQRQKIIDEENQGTSGDGGGMKSI